MLSKVTVLKIMLVNDVNPRVLILTCFLGFAAMAFNITYTQLITILILLDVHREPTNLWTFHTLRYQISSGKDGSRIDKIPCCRNGIVGFHSHHRIFSQTDHNPYLFLFFSCS